MTEFYNENGPSINSNLARSANPRNPFQRDDGVGTGFLHSVVDANGNRILGHEQSKRSLEMVDARSVTPDIFKGGSDNGLVPSSPAIEGGSPQCLEDYKCPICLDTFINTVKVDCSYGHKFCNFCIQCWINFERHLVTECPVCRGPIFGKSLDLKTDAEIRAIYDSLSEEEKRTRLLSIKERLQLEYPNSHSNIQQQHSTPGFQIPMRVSDPPHHHFNHDLHIPIPLVGVMEGAVQYTAHPQEHDFYQNYGENDAQLWPQGIFYPAAWNGSYSPIDYQNVLNINNLEQPYQNQSVDPTDVHHQHYHHQNEESSRWDNNLYLTVDDNSSRQSSLHDAGSLGHAYQTASRMPHRNGTYSSLQDHNMRLNSPLLNYSPPVSPQSVYHSDQYPVSYFSHSSAAQVPIQPNLTAPSHLCGIYCCYLPTCPSHHHCSGAGPNAQFTSHNNIMQPNAHRYHAANGCPNVNGGSDINGGNVPVESNSCHNFSGNINPSPRIRPNMPGTSSTTIQLPSPNNSTSGIRLRPRSPTSTYHHAPSHPNNNDYAQPTIRQPVSRCPSRNNGAQFAGGFSLFSSGYMRFQISHVPTTIMIGDRYVSTPPAHLTHPLVSLIPLNQDGSSARVSLTFEVHRV